MQQLTMLYRPWATTFPVGLYGVQIYSEAQPDPVVLIIEGPGNQGLSATNAYELLASHVVQTYQVDPEGLWLLHYPEHGDYKLVDMEFDPATGRFAYPNWFRFTLPALQVLVKELYQPMSWDETILAYYKQYQGLDQCTQLS